MCGAAGAKVQRRSQRTMLEHYLTWLNYKVKEEVATYLEFNVREKMSLDILEYKFGGFLRHASRGYKVCLDKKKGELPYEFSKKEKCSQADGPARKKMYPIEEKRRSTAGRLRIFELLAFWTKEDSRNLNTWEN